jgi:ABC-type nitrate/sulfonate/bicarbonate transport system substrate-binding protein
LLAVLLLVGCQPLTVPAQPEGESSQPEGESEDIISIRVCHSPSMHFNQVSVIDARNMWHDAGLDAEVFKFAAGRLALQSLLGDECDFATVADTPLVGAAFQGHDVAIIADTVRAPSYEILARKDHGIEAPGDLAGKTIGVTLGTSVHFRLGDLLRKHNLTGSVNISNVPPPEMVSAIERGDVDAIVTWEPNMLEAKEVLGDRGIAWPATDAPSRGFLVTTGEYYQQNPEAVRRMLTVLLSAEQFMAENPQEAQELVSGYAQIDSHIVQELWDVHDWSSIMDAQAIEEMEEQAEWMLSEGLQEGERPDYGQFFYSSALREIRPSAVNMD